MEIPSNLYWKGIPKRENKGEVVFTRAYIPYKGYYSSPFSKWQLTLAEEHAFLLAANTIKKWMESRQIDPRNFDYLYLGFTVHHRQAFYGAPWIAGIIGADHMSGCNVSQACSTATTCLYNSAAGIENGNFDTALNLLADRMSNGPFIVWPNPKGPGGQLIQEDWVMYNFANDPYARQGMLEGADKVAKAENISKLECDELAARRYEQYRDALKHDREFQKRYFFPVEIQSKKKTAVLTEDEGVMVNTNLEELTALEPARPGGVHSFGGQTHPADGNASIIVTTREKAQNFSADPSIEIQLLSYGYSRVEKGCTPMAPLPAALNALSKAGIDIKEVKTVKTHNPFAVNDIYLARNLGIDPLTIINNYGCPLVFGHPQGPTVARCVIELIEELVVKGGGYGLFTGCAAGDTGTALVLKVGS